MVMCTKALLDVNPEPTDDEIRYALRNNYCRCTGYVKIMDAVRLAAKILKEGVLPDDGDSSWTLGSRVSRIDVEEKVLGTGKYPDDYYPANESVSGTQDLQVCPSMITVQAPQAPSLQPSFAEVMCSSSRRNRNSF